jgi:hypothetical protein
VNECRVRAAQGGIGGAGRPDSACKPKSVFADPERLRPRTIRAAPAAKDAAEFAELAGQLYTRVNARQVVAYFVHRLVFCLHRALNTAVVTAYDWPVNLEDDGVIERLLALNLEQQLSRTC